MTAKLLGPLRSDRIRGGLDPTTEGIGEVCKCLTQPAQYVNLRLSLNSHQAIGGP